MGYCRQYNLIFYSDNGGRVLGRGKKSLYSDWEFDFPLRSGKASSYDGGLRVPAVVRWPEKLPDRLTTDVPVIIEDIYATVLNASGAQVSPGYQVDGKDWSFLLSENQQLIKEFYKRELFFIMPYRFDGPQYNGPDFANYGVEPAATLIKSNWKLIYFFEDERFELYNINEDLSEINNLFEREHKKAKNLVAILDKNMRQKQVGDVMPIRLPERSQVRRRMQSLIASEEVKSN